MLAHNQAKILNADNLPRGLPVDYRAVAGYFDLWVDVLLVQRLPAWHRNVGKRLVKASTVHVRDILVASRRSNGFDRNRGQTDFQWSRLHRSDCVGRGNRIFRIPKFRSIRTDAPQAATQLFGNPGPYPTPTGGFLRRSSLDELPQLLFSVLRGS